MHIQAQFQFKPLVFELHQGIHAGFLLFWLVEGIKLPFVLLEIL